MKLILILFILIGVMVEISFQTNKIIVEKIKHEKRLSLIRLRSFNVFSRELLDLKRDFEFKQHLKNEKEKNALEIKDKLLLEHENERRRLFELHLGSRNQGSSFHRESFLVLLG